MISTRGTGWPHIEGRTAELGLTGSDAIARAAQPPSDINRQRERASGQPTWKQLTDQPDTARMNHVDGKQSPRPGQDGPTGFLSTARCPTFPCTSA